MKNKTSLFVLAIWVVSLVGVGMISYYEGGRSATEDHTREYRQSSIKAGYAQYDAESGAWRWKTPEEVALYLVTSGRLFPVRTPQQEAPKTTSTIIAKQSVENEVEEAPLFPDEPILKEESDLPKDGKSSKKKN